MALTIKDTLPGLRPATTPKRVITVPVATGSTIYQYSPVVLVAGEATILAQTPAVNRCDGVALSYGAAGENIQVCIDDTQEYSILADGGTVAQLVADIGQFASGVTNHTGSATNKVSNVVLDYSGNSATVANGTYYMQIVGMANDVGNSVAAGYNRVLVRLINVGQTFNSAVTT